MKEIVSHILNLIVGFSERHESLIGKTAVVGARLEFAINILFGYVFDIKYDHREIITGRVKSVRAKIDMIIPAVDAGICKFDSKIKRQILSDLKEVSPFLDMNNLVHGMIVPDLDELTSMLKAPTPNTISAATKVAESRISISSFNAKSHEMKIRTYEVDEIKDIIKNAETVISSINNINNTVRPDNYYEYLLPESEIVKLEREISSK